MTAQGTHRHAQSLERIPIARHPLANPARVELRPLVLPHLHDMPERARVRDDARDVRADVVEVREERAAAARAVDVARHLERTGAGGRAEG